MTQPLLRGASGAEAATPDGRDSAVGSLALRMSSKPSAETPFRHSHTRSRSAHTDAQERDADTAGPQDDTSLTKNGSEIPASQAAPLEDAHVEVDVEVCSGAPSMQRPDGSAGSVEVDTSKPKLFSDTPEGQFAEVTCASTQLARQLLLVLAGGRRRVGMVASSAA